MKTLCSVDCDSKYWDEGRGQAIERVNKHFFDAVLAKMKEQKLGEGRLFLKAVFVPAGGEMEEVVGLAMSIVSGRRKVSDLSDKEMFLLGFDTDCSLARYLGPLSGQAVVEKAEQIILDRLNS